MLDGALVCWESFLAGGFVWALGYGALVSEEPFTRFSLTEMFACESGWICPARFKYKVLFCVGFSGFRSGGLA